MSQKATYKPLYEGGFHGKTLKQMKEELVVAFPSSQTRRALYNKFELFLDHIFKKLGMKPDAIWVDGSYTTIKENPEDIDILLVIDEHNFNTMSTSNQNELKKILSTKSFSALYSCDVYIAISSDKAKLSYWRGWFGFDREDNSKGIVKLTIGGSV